MRINVMVGVVAVLIGSGVVDASAAPGGHSGAAMGGAGVHAFAGGQYGGDVAGLNTGRSVGVDRGFGGRGGFYGDGFGDGYDYSDYGCDPIMAQQGVCPGAD